MKLEEFQRISKNVKTVISKFRENPGKFAAIVLKMYWNMKAERDTLIDDIAVLRANNKRLERELKKKNMDADRLGYRWRNSHDEAKTYKSLLSEISQHIGNKPSSSTYKYFRAKLDELGIKEGD